MHILTCYITHHPNLYWPYHTSPALYSKLLHRPIQLRGCLHEETCTDTSFIPGWLFYFVYRVYIMTGSFHISLFEGTLRVDKIHVRFKIANITNVLPVPVYRQTDFTPKRVYLIPLRDFVPEWNSRAGTTTGMNSCRGGSRRNDFCGGIM